jgi:SAM-dependent methyltransferase
LTVQTRPAGSAYDEFAYPGYANPATHPAKLEAVGRLFGLEVPPAATARVLELGCGDGGNILSIAQSLPRADCVGLDAAAGAIARGAALAAAAGLDNAVLRVADFEALPADLGSFDYILAHGVYSWIPPRTRGFLLEACRNLLTPNGIAFVSYNAYPGSYLRDMARDMLHYHAREAVEPGERLARAHELMAVIAAIEEPDPFSQVLRQYMERMLQAPGALLVHDDLAEISTPFYFHEFLDHVEGHALRFLSEAELHESQMTVPQSAGDLIAALPDDRVVREQYLDFFKNRMFRQTLLCRADAAVQDLLTDTAVEELVASSFARPDALDPDGPAPEPGTETFATPEGFTITTSEPLVRAVMHALAAATPGSLEFQTLLDHAIAAAPDVPQDAVRTRLREVMLQAHLGRIVGLAGCAPPLVALAGDRPLALSLSRAQCQAGSLIVSSLLHINVKLEDDPDPRLLPLLDGTRTREELQEAANASEAEVNDALERFAASGLLTRAATPRSGASTASG